ncbi:MAG: histidine kinase [Acidobacteriota bacterium]|nr:histidine kinase [Acidobacteriota bacterium]
MTRERTRALVRFTLANLAIWIAFAFFNSSETYRRVVASGSMMPWLEVLCYQLSSSLLWAAFTPPIVAFAERFPLRAPHRMRSIVALLAFTPVIALLRAASGGIVSDLAEGKTPSVAFMMLSIYVRFYRNVFLILVIVGVTNLILARRAAAERERHALALKTEVANAELQRLRSSMQPRLMFSILDAIRARVNEPNVADRMLVALGDLLRAMLDFGKRSTVLLAEELELLDRYFEIEKTRTDGAFTSRLDVDEELLHVRVPPLVLHALVEAAMFRDGDSAARHLEIHGRGGRGILRFEVRNERPHRPPLPHEVEQTRAHLEEAYAGAAFVGCRVEGDAIVTELRMTVAIEEAG